jgi:L-glutamine-phosphate cytidylyltransferase
MVFAFALWLRVSGCVRSRPSFRAAWITPDFFYVHAPISNEGDPVQSDLKMVLLAAGRGSRLLDLTEHRPKALVPISGRPLLAWLLDAIHKAGIASPFLLTGYRAEAFDEFGLETIHNPDWEQTNIVSSLICAREILYSYRTLVSYTDILYSADDLLRLGAASAPVCLAYDPHWRELWSRRFLNPLDDAETFEIDADGRLKDIGERPTGFEHVGGQYMGLLSVSPEGWRGIEAVLTTLSPESVAKLDMTSLLRRCIYQHGMFIRGVPIGSPWCEVDAPSDIPIAEEVLRALNME